MKTFEEIKEIVRIIKGSHLPTLYLQDILEEVHNEAVNITSVEDKMYSKDEVIELLAKYSRDHQGFHAEKFHDWTTDNL
jgi:hypothetical protein